MRLIDADTIFDGKLLVVSDVAYDAVQAIIEKINNAPTVDIEPVRHGYWKLNSFGGNWTCSKCGCKPYHSNMENMNYCPNCGAKMDEVRDE